ncbi:hypothetical protein [Streptomyces sp. NPDC002156]
MTGSHSSSLSIPPVRRGRLAAGEAAGLPDPGRDPDLCARLARRALPLVEIQTAGGGRLGTSGKRHVDGALSRGLRYTGHDGHDDGVVRTLRVGMADEATGLRVTAVPAARRGAGAICECRRPGRRRPRGSSRTSTVVCPRSGCRSKRTRC